MLRRSLLAALLLSSACQVPFAARTKDVEFPQDSPARDTSLSTGETEVDEAPDAPPDGPERVYDPTVVQSYHLRLTDDAIAALRASPAEYVEARFEAEGRVHAPVGVRLKGNSSFQDIDGKPAWKIRFNEYERDLRFHGLKRLTLDNNVWDPTCMSENLGYRFFREAGSPAPRTGYATLSLNDQPLGLYTIVESMDDLFIESRWPDQEGALYEMTRSCDFTSDCSCYELQDQTDGYNPNLFDAVCALVQRGDSASIREAFAWEPLIAFFAAERVVNHPDSYSYNLNNYYIWFDAVEQRASLSPWGGDSMFTYHYPPDQVDWPCQPMTQYDNLRRSPLGWLAHWCESDPECGAELHVAMGTQAELMDGIGLSDLIHETAALLRPYASAEPDGVNWGLEHFEYTTACFETWVSQRPEEIRRFLGE